MAHPVWGEPCTPSPRRRRRPAPWQWHVFRTGLANQFVALCVGAGIAVRRGLTFGDSYDPRSFTGDGPNLAGFSEAIYLGLAIIIGLLALIVALAGLLSLRVSTRAVGLGIGVVVQLTVIPGTAWTLLGGLTAPLLVLLAGTVYVVVGLAGPSTWMWCHITGRQTAAIAAPREPAN